jgi:hypothetical protein
MQTHIPLNNDNEPDKDGTSYARNNSPEVPWEYHENNHTISDVDDL